VEDNTSISRDDWLAKLALGTIIQVNNESGSLKYSSEISGYQKGLLITSLPSPEKLKLSLDDFKQHFSNDTALVIRMVVDGSIYAFRSPVKGVNTRACALLFSEVPDKIQVRRLRGGVRYPCVLQAGLLIGEVRYRGVLTNISAGGCLLQMKAKASTDDLKILKEQERATLMNVRFPFEDQDTAISVKVKSLAEDKQGQLSLGISFAEVGEVAFVVKKYLDFMQLEELSEYLFLD
jgi:c-di-GMP-binding flagellar brake protein YcgR